MFPLIREWEESNERRDAFCEKHNLPVSTFSYWRTRYARSQKAAVQPGFVKLQAEVEGHLEVVYPNGVKVRLPQGSSLAEVRSLIKLV